MNDLLQFHDVVFAHGWRCVFMEVAELSIGVLYKLCDHILRRLEKTGRQVILMVNFYLYVFYILHMKHMCICFTVVWV